VGAEDLLLDVGVCEVGAPTAGAASLHLLLGAIVASGLPLPGPLWQAPVLVCGGALQAPFCGAHGPGTDAGAGAHASAIDRLRAVAMTDRLRAAAMTDLALRAALRPSPRRVSAPVVENPVS
jgi:hypothetical protein